MSAFEPQSTMDTFQDYLPETAIRKPLLAFLASGKEDFGKEDDSLSKGGLDAAWSIRWIEIGIILLAEELRLHAPKAEVASRRGPHYNRIPAVVSISNYKEPLRCVGRLS